MPSVRRDDAVAAGALGLVEARVGGGEERGGVGSLAASPLQRLGRRE
jgi:hypothetical protein